MDSYQHHQRARWPRTSHGSVDRQRNDRLGRTRQRRLFEHRRAILRGYTNSDTHANTYSDGDGHSNSYSYSDGYSYSYSDGHSYSYSDAYAYTDHSSGLSDINID